MKGLWTSFPLFKEKSLFFKQEFINIEKTINIKEEDYIGLFLFNHNVDVHNKKCEAKALEFRKQKLGTIIL